jgi:hypothetical protein
MRHPAQPGSCIKKLFRLLRSLIFEARIRYSQRVRKVF